MNNPLSPRPMSHRMFAVVLAAFVNVALLSAVNGMALLESAPAQSGQAQAQTPVDASGPHKG